LCPQPAADDQQFWLTHPPVPDDNQAAQPEASWCSGGSVMKNTTACRLGVVLGLLFAASAGPTEGGPAPEKAQDPIAVGKELFTREWLPGDKRSHAGDGLGPVFNARSCVACHHQGGIGGSGPKQNNAILISAFVDLSRGPFIVTGVVINQDPEPKGPVKQPDRAKLAEIHPALLTDASFPLHRFSSEKEYAAWKIAAFGVRGVDAVGSDVPDAGAIGQATRTVDGVKLALIASQRRPPALFGTGLIDTIPDRVIEAVAVEQQKTADATKNVKLVVRERPAAFGGASEVALPIAGRVARLKDGRIGRFGWKGHVATLREFTLQACASELGLEVPGFHRAAPPWKKDYRAPGIDMTARQCDQLIHFVASLPRPVFRAAETPQHAAEIKAGQKLFATVGCAVCHRPKVGDVEGIYSDLLLHDMGQSLNDAGSYGVIEAEVAKSGGVNPLPASGFDQAVNRQKPPKFGATAREWRTPPLWAFRDSGPYLHDGRADTLGEAVALHGGEGFTAAQAFSRLTPRERMQVEMFLQSLAAPPPAG
jgi:CxxC motif-containing protein (DUF1111 family)